MNLRDPYVFNYLGTGLITSDHLPCIFVELCYFCKIHKMSIFI